MALAVADLAAVAQQFVGPRRSHNPLDPLSAASLSSSGPFQRWSGPKSGTEFFGSKRRPEYTMRDMAFCEAAAQP